MSNSLDKQISDWVKGLGFREVIFSLEVINLMFGDRINLKTDNGYILEILKNHITCEKHLHDLKYYVKRDLVSNEWTDWVLQSKRHGLWFANHQKILELCRPISDIHPNYFKNLICKIDLVRWRPKGKIDYDAGRKADVYSIVKEDYESTLHYLTHFKWIKKDDENLLDWCLDYLNHKQLLLKDWLTYLDGLADKHDVVMVSIQFNWNCLKSIENQPLKEKMHKAWTQKKWRDKKRVRKQP